MRIIKFFFLFLLIATAVLGGIISLNWTAFRTVFTNRSSLAEGSEFVPMTYSLAGLLEYSKTQPQHVSVVSYPYADTVSTLNFNADRPNILGDLQDFLLLLEASRQKEMGRISWDGMYSTDLIEKFHVLPKMKSELDDVLELDEISLKELIFQALNHSEPAFSDALIHILGEENVTSIPQTFNLQADAPRPFAGTLIAWLEAGKSAPTEEAIFQNHSLIFNRDEFRAEYRNKLDEIWPMSFDNEKLLYTNFSKASANQLLKPLMAALADSLISKEVSMSVIEMMRENYPTTEVGRGLIDYGAIFDTRLGQLSGIDFGTSEYTNERFAQVVFFDQVPTGLWFHMSSNFMNQDFQQRLMWDPGFRARAVDSLMTSSN